MATFSEVKYVKQVTWLPEQSTVNVQWANAIKKDGEVISETFERCAYTADQKDTFLADVEGADSYVKAIGW